jgi:hypothetical protein
MVSVLRECQSTLIPDEAGELTLKLMQLTGSFAVMGRRSGFVGVQERTSPTSEEISACRALLETTEVRALNVVSFLPGMVGCVSDLERLAATRTIVTLAGVHGEERHNWAFIATNGSLQRQAKLSLSSEDQQAGVRPGAELNFYGASDGDAAVRWVVLNCHDYTNIKLLLPLLQRRVELIVVVAYNNATRLYWEYAVGYASPLLLRCDRQRRRRVRSLQEVWLRKVCHLQRGGPGFWCAGTRRTQRNVSAELRRTSKDAR